MMRIFKQFKRVVLLISTLGLSALPGGGVLAQSATPEVEKAGVIQELTRETNQLVIDGVRYRVALDAQVEIRGAQAAFALLRTGMKVAFTYRDFGDALEIFLLEQLPDNTTLEEV